MLLANSIEQRRENVVLWLIWELWLLNGIWSRIAHHHVLRVVVLRSSKIVRSAAYHAIIGDWEACHSHGCSSIPVLHIGCSTREHVQKVGHLRILHLVLHSDRKLCVEI